MKLTAPVYSDKIKKSVQERFSGYFHSPAAGDGELFDMANLTSDYYPLLASRPPRRRLTQALTAPGGIYGYDELCWVDGTKVYYNGSEVAGLTVTAGQKTFGTLGNYIVILPDKKYYNYATGEYGGIESSVSLASVYFQNGTLYGESADANTIYRAGAAWGSYFKVGDAVTISGCTVHAENNKTPIIREIDGDTMRFYENVFTLDKEYIYTVGSSGLAQKTGSTDIEYYFTFAGTNYKFTLAASLVSGDKLVYSGSGTSLTIRYASGATSGTRPLTAATGSKVIVLYEYPKAYTEGSTTITIKRAMPDMDYICTHDNRLWGGKDDTIYASKLGDVFNWNVFDGVETDSYWTDIGSEGDITGCCSYTGLPIFFKENHLYKIYGDYPSNYQVYDSMSLGLAEGCGGSIAKAGEVLFYVSRNGVVAYSGGVPTVISQDLGLARFHNAVGGSDGMKYYVSMQDDEDNWHLFVYDTQRSLWHREDDAHALHFARTDALYMLDASGVIWLMGRVTGATEGTEAEDKVEWMAEFGDFADSNPNAKGVSKLQMRMELESGARCEVYIRFDGGTWTKVHTVTAAEKRSCYIPIVPRRADHYRVKLTGWGGMRLYSLAREYYVGSEGKTRR